jgi:2,3-bisphosphoglycerate-dependent phosphoglycerate mutase
MASRCSLLLVAAQLCAALQLPQLPANGWALAARAPFLRRLVPPGLYDESGPSDGVSPAWRAASLALGSLPPNEGSEECAVDPGDMCLVPPATGRVIFLRHGESTWNQADRFTGWEDVPLSPAGEAQVAGAAEALEASGYCFDAVYTSTLKRTIKTAWLLLEALDQFAIPLQQNWRLNERMYGALTGLNKRETREALGEAAFEELRRQPPPISPDSCYDPARSSRFSDVPAGELPKKESFEDTAARVLPFWKEEILPRAANGETVLIISSKNCLRALLMGVATHVPPEQMIDLDIPNCQPLVFDPASGSLELLRPEGQAAEGAGTSASASAWAALAAGKKFSLSGMPKAVGASVRRGKAEEASSS